MLVAIGGLDSVKLWLTLGQCSTGWMEIPRPVRRSCQTICWSGPDIGERPRLIRAREGKKEQQLSSAWLLYGEDVYNPYIWTDEKKEWKVFKDVVRRPRQADRLATTGPQVVIKVEKGSRECTYIPKKGTRDGSSRTWKMTSKDRGFRTGTRNE